MGYFIKKSEHFIAAQKGGELAMDFSDCVNLLDWAGRTSTALPVV